MNRKFKMTSFGSMSPFTVVADDSEFSPLGVPMGCMGAASASADATNSEMESFMSDAEKSTKVKHFNLATPERAKVATMKSPKTTDPRPSPYGVTGRPVGLESTNGGEVFETIRAAAELIDRRLAARVANDRWVLPTVCLGLLLDIS